MLQGSQTAISNRLIQQRAMVKAFGSTSSCSSGTWYRTVLMATKATSCWANMAMTLAWYAAGIRHAG
jgi:hypothetical protein